MTAAAAAPGASADPPDIVERGLQAAGRLAGAAGCIVLVEESGSVNLRWAMNGLTTNGVVSAQSVTVAVTADVSGGQSVGVLTRPAVDADGVADLVADALAVARAGAAAEDAAPLIAGDQAADWHEPAVSTGPSVLAAFGAGLGEMFAASRAGGREVFGFAEHQVRTTWLGTSAGLRIRHVQPSGIVELNGK